MRPFARVLLFTILCTTLCVAFGSLAIQAQSPIAPDGPTNVLDSSALPDPSFPAWSGWQGESTEDLWTPRGPEDYVGFELGVVGLVRQKPTGQVIANNVAADNSRQPLLNADEFQGDMQFGVAAKLDLYQISNRFGGTDLQLGYWGINSLDATRTVESGRVETIFFGGTTRDPITRFNYIYSSNLYSGEANLRLRNRQRWRPLVGMRYLKLEDTFDQFDFMAGGGRSGFFSLTNNSLFGAQLGIEGTIVRYRSWDWFAIGKYGAMHNRVEGSALVEFGGADAVKNYHGSEFCSLIDVQTGLTYRFVDQLQFRAAYQALYCSDMALGVDQSGAIDFFGVPDQVVFDSRYWQGVSLTATFSF